MEIEEHLQRGEVEKTLLSSILNLDIHFSLVKRSPVRYNLPFLMQQLYKKKKRDTFFQINHEPPQHTFLRNCIEIIFAHCLFVELLPGGDDEREGGEEGDGGRVVEPEYTGIYRNCVRFHQPL